MGNGRTWTEADKNYLAEHHGEMTYEQLGKALDRTPKAISAAVVAWGLGKRGQAMSALRTKSNPNKITDTAIFHTCVWHSEGASVKWLAKLFDRPENVITNIIRQAIKSGNYKKYVAEARARRKQIN